MARGAPFPPSRMPASDDLSTKLVVCLLGSISDKRTKWFSIRNRKRMRVEKLYLDSKHPDGVFCTRTCTRASSLMQILSAGISNPCGYINQPGSICTRPGERARTTITVVPQYGKPDSGPSSQSQGAAVALLQPVQAAECSGASPGHERRRWSRPRLGAPPPRSAAAGPGRGVSPPVRPRCHGASAACQGRGVPPPVRREVPPPVRREVPPPVQAPASD